MVNIEETVVNYMKTFDAKRDAAYPELSEVTIGVAIKMLKQGLEPIYVRSYLEISKEDFDKIYVCSSKID
jgi:hypothetical protein